MNFLSLIEAKRDGQSISPDHIDALVRDFTAGKIPDYQMAAFLMAVFFRGLDHEETTRLTLAMRDSGDQLKFPADPRPLVDKHSTGGVGDKVSLVLAPLLACLGFRVPMISGRGLGITGGTLDKLDSIPGFRTSLAAEEITDIVQSVGCVICGQTKTMVPADKGLYSLRDVTGTVPSIPLIVASILSKKLAENIRALILDVKFGRAAFMMNQDQARQLGHEMVKMGNACGVNTRALLTRMDAPLGQAVGNLLEVRESIRTLEGQGPSDLVEVILECAAQLLLQTVKASDIHSAREQARECLKSGKPRARWDELLRAQGADPAQLSDHLAQSSRTVPMVEVKSPQAGFIQDCNARILGEIVRDLGGGRLSKESVLNFHAGLDQLAKPGQHIQAGEPLARIFGATKEKAEAFVPRVIEAYRFSEVTCPPGPLIFEVIDQL